ncbi:MAG: hypothetical protein SLRJCFUN_001099 [Candidatus Fervidibacter sp.]
MLGKLRLESRAIPEPMKDKQFFNSPDLWSTQSFTMLYRRSRRNPSLTMTAMRAKEVLD